eukprot:scaffold116956_cov58-Phaeocystis_antarctica.AAC.1
MQLYVIISSPERLNRRASKTACFHGGGKPSAAPLGTFQREEVCSRWSEALGAAASSAWAICFSGLAMNHVHPSTWESDASSTATAVPRKKPRGHSGSPVRKGLRRLHWCSASTRTVATYAHRGQRPAGAGAMEGLNPPMTRARAAPARAAAARGDTGRAATARRPAGRRACVQRRSVDHRRARVRPLPSALWWKGSIAAGYLSRVRGCMPPRDAGSPDPPDYGRKPGPLQVIHFTNFENCNRLGDRSAQGQHVQDTRGNSLLDGTPTCHAASRAILPAHDARGT